MKVLKIVVTSYVPRIRRETSKLCGNPAGYFSHSQRFESPMEIQKLLELVRVTHLISNNDATVDLLFVNNYVPGSEIYFTSENLVYRSSDNFQTKLLDRENIGRSFGGYRDAFLLNKNDYDYFIFTEDDILVWRDGYADCAIDLIERDNGIGFVAYQGLNRRFRKFKLDDALHAHGGVGLASREALNGLIQLFGDIPFANDPADQRYETIIEKGEVAFTNMIHKAGFRLTELPKNQRYYDYAYDLMRGRVVERYPSKLALMMYHLKKSLGKVLASHSSESEG